MTQDQEKPSRRGIWLYDGHIECRVEIWQRDERPGTGDYEDPPELADDQPGECYEVLYEPAGGGRMGQGGGGHFSTLPPPPHAPHASTHAHARLGSFPSLNHPPTNPSSLRARLAYL